MDRSDTDSIITPKRKRGERGKGKNNKRKAVEDIINPAKAKRTRRPRDPNYIPIKKVKGIDPSKRSTIAKELGVSTQTLYNREEVFSRLIPFYISGTEEVKKKGKSLKEFPPLTLFQQFIHRQFETLRRSLPLKDCTPFMSTVYVYHSHLLLTKPDQDRKPNIFLKPDQKPPPPPPPPNKPPPPLEV